MNKPFLLIAGDNYYPDAGTGDWVECFTTREEALIIAEEKIRNGCDWYKIVDLREWTNN